ncbi:uncharacterized protein PRCAT00002132001 [Priceomyces carsonii]|uniref:uncharacterized protein n=1 Tax=Priceomyces carsonii TaxID=28549 RepID=UPI002ED82606|nr:unnamed protein product [Priceomyces carsonii]
MLILRWLSIFPLALLTLKVVAGNNNGKCMVPYEECPSNNFNKLTGLPKASILVTSVVSKGTSYDITVHFQSTALPYTIDALWELKITQPVNTFIYSVNGGVKGINNPKNFYYTFNLPASSMHAGSSTNELCIPPIAFQFDLCTGTKNPPKQCKKASSTPCESSTPESSTPYESSTPPSPTTQHSTPYESSIPPSPIPESSLKILTTPLPVSITSIQITTSTVSTSTETGTATSTLTICAKGGHCVTVTTTYCPSELETAIGSPSGPGSTETIKKLTPLGTYESANTEVSPLIETTSTRGSPEIAAESTKLTSGTPPLTTGSSIVTEAGSSSTSSSVASFETIPASGSSSVSSESATVSTFEGSANFLSSKKSILSVIAATFATFFI